MVGRGGVGEVWAARDLLVGRDVAVKTVAVSAGRDAGPRGSDLPDGTDLLRHEAAVTSSVDHPGVVDVHDAGRDEAIAYLVMDLVPGPDLAALLREGPIPAPEAVRIAARVADALAAAHRAGVVHGDVKPANVVIGEDVVALVDFGAAPADRGGPLTYGTAPYMAPEQVLTRALTPATDVYALGCMLHAALTGRPPFLGDSPMTVLHRHVRERPPQLGELLRGLPPALDALVARMLAKEPEVRGTAAQVYDELAAVAADGALRDIEPVPVADDDGHLDPHATQPALVLLPTPGTPATPATPATAAAEGTPRTLARRAA